MTNSKEKHLNSNVPIMETPQPKLLNYPATVRKSECHRIACQRFCVSKAVFVFRFSE